MFSVSWEFIIQMVIYMAFGWLVLSFILFLLKKYSQNRLLLKISLLKCVLAGMIIVLFISFIFVINSAFTFNKILKEIKNSTTSKIVNSELNRESGNFQEKEIPLDENVKLLLVKMLSEQQYQLQAYGYSIATLEYIDINVPNKCNIQIIDSNFVAFKYGIFHYRCEAQNEELLTRIRKLWINN